MAVKIVEDSAVLTLDFWDKETIYNGQVFPVGTLACDALNIPGEVVSHMEKLCEKLNGFMKTFASGKGDPALLPEAKFSAMKLLELMAKYKPFSYINMTAFRDLVKRCFTPNGVKSANVLIQAQKNSKLSDQIAEKYLDGALLSRLLPTLAHFGYSLKAYQETMLPFAQRLHDSEDRARADYARIFDNYFPKEPTFEDAGGWMSMTNVTMQYLTMEHPGGDLPVLVTRSHYVSFVGMLRGDFFEALRAGHGVRRCFHSIEETQMRLDGVKIRYGEVARIAEQAAASSWPAGDSEQQVQEVQQAASRMGAIFAKLKESVFYGFSFSNGFETLKEGLNWLANSFKQLPSTVAKATGSVLKSIGNLAKTGAKGLVSLAGKASNAFLSLIKSSNQMNNSFGSGIMTMLKYSLGIRSLYTLFNKLRSALTDGFKNLAQFSEPVNSGISAITSALSQLKNSLAAAFAPILTTVAPILTQFINMLSSAANAIARLTAALTGQKSYTKATAVQEDYAASLEGTAGAAEEASKSLMGFDEINKLSAETASGGGGAGAGGMFETQEVEPLSFDSWGQAFSAALDSILNDGIPRLKAGLTAFANWLNTFSANLYEMFTFPGVYEKIVLLGMELANAMSGLVNQIDWSTLGGALGAGLNTALGLLVSFIYTFDWLNLGASIADLVNNAISEIDWSNVGAWLWAKFKIAIETLAGFLLNIDMTQLAQAAGNIVIGFFNSMTETIQNIDWYALGEQVKVFLVSIDWISVAESVFTAIGSAFGAAASFLWGLIEEAWGEVVNWWNEAAYEDGEFTIEGLLNGILEALKDIGQWINDNIFQPFIDGFKAAFGIHSPSTVMEEQGGYIISGLLNGIKTAWQNVKTWISTALSDIKDGFAEAWNAVRDTTASIWDGIVSTIKGAVNGVIGVINRMISAVVNGINSLFSTLSFSIDLPGGRSIGLSLPQFSIPQIPYLAQGAVIPPNREFLAILGDQTSGTNIEAPEDLIRKIVREETARNGGDDRVTELLETLIAVVEGIEIGDTTIGKAAERYNRVASRARGY